MPLSFGLTQGEVLITTRVTSYRKLRLGSLEHLGWGQVDLPEQQMLTAACWLTLAESLVERLREEGWWVGDHVESRGPILGAPTGPGARARSLPLSVVRRSGAAGRSHDVHHIVPFREFGWHPGENNERPASQPTLQPADAMCHVPPTSRATGCCAKHSGGSRPSAGPPHSPAPDVRRGRRRY